MIAENIYGNYANYPEPRLPEMFVQIARKKRQDFGKVLPAEADANVPVTELKHS